ncbi:inositol 2-dehydrogenase [Paenibacillus mucilaginosus]|uniref:Oxidoreductase domain protein n=1 Tax=Paenibacillus mucilaginosus (strain KNP414) TaxID=1036673 RepID=F8FGG5_PAEMK|nr:inositol 2-dehydrogenase [Paenibacillus mucilaginosus]AEI44625.1 oxidoreductase domain protein [Paenibacillus mucilaginosus KNP414]MCG7215559.1 inositol 2-dehydrogenase [Paenibacillus mucilaginosus]WDM26188.1 inositol 2-dehydrogenase [Paenibacillus mucilaginosus]
MKKIRIGIIGAGRIGKIHADNLLRLPGAEVAAISDLFAGEELEAWAAQRGIGQVTKDSGPILSRADIDAVFICSSTDTHVGLIIEAARAGKHIFCEKPVSMDLSATEAAIEAVQAAGVKLQVGFNRRFDHNFRRVREHVLQGTVGEPHIVRITSRDPNPPHPDYIARSGGLFMDMMIHDFDMARFLSGSEVVEVYAQGGVLVDPVFAEHGDVDTAIVTLRFASGALGVIDNSRQAVYGYDQRVEVFGSRGSAAVSNDHPNTAEVSTAEGLLRDKPLHFFLERYNEAYMDETRQFVEALLHDRPLPVDGIDALQAERIAHAAKLSWQQGRPVKLSEIGTAGAGAGVQVQSEVV